MAFRVLLNFVLVFIFVLDSSIAQTIENSKKKIEIKLKSPDTIKSDSVVKSNPVIDKSFEDESSVSKETKSTKKSEKETHDSKKNNKSVKKHFNSSKDIAKKKEEKKSLEVVILDKLLSNNVLKYINASLENSPDIKERLANKEESEYLVKQSYLSVLPSVTAGAGTGAQYNDSPGAESRKFDAQDLSVNVHQNIFGEGKITDIQINKSVFKSKQQELEQIQNLITLSTVEAYLNTIRYLKVEEIQKISIDSHEDTLKKTRIRLDAGLMRASDLFLTEARTASAKSNLTATRSQLERSRNLLHRYSQIEIDNKDLVDIDAPKKIPDTFEDAWQEVLENNPIVKAKYYEIKTSDLSRKKEKIALFPSLSFDLLAQKTFDASGIVGADKELTAMLNLDYDFNFGSNYYKTAAAGSRAKLRRYEYQKSKSDIYENLSSLYTDYAQLNERIKFLQGNRDFLENVVKKHKKEFEAGFRSLFDTLNTKNEFFNADIQYINALYDKKILAFTILANTGQLLTYFGK